MACDRNKRSVSTKAARRSGISERSQIACHTESSVLSLSKPEVNPDLKKLGCLVELRDSRDVPDTVIRGEQVAKLLGIKPEQRRYRSKGIFSAVEVITNLYGERAWLAVGDNSLGVVLDAGNDWYGIQEVFVPADDHAVKGNPSWQSLMVLKNTDETISEDDVVEFFSGDNSELKLENDEEIRQRYGPQSWLAINKNIIGVVRYAGNHRFRVQEIFLSAPGKEKSRKEIKQAPLAVSTQKIHRAIQDTKKLVVLYKGPNGVRRYNLIPLVVAAGRTDETKGNKYLWGYSENA